MSRLSPTSVASADEDMNSPAGGRLRYVIPNVVSAANISVGFAAIMVASQGRFDLAVYLLYVAIVFDILDGRLARWLNATSEIGKQLDSFCDAVSFGIAPAFLVYQAILVEAGGLGFVVALAYLLAGVFRLARYNVITDAHTKDATSVGVPIPIGAGYLMAVALMRDHLQPWLAATVVLFLAAAMISRWEVPNLKGRSLVTAMLLVGIVNYTVVVVWPGWPTVVWWNAWNVAILVAARRPRRHVAA